MAVRAPRGRWRRWLDSRAIALRFWALEGDAVVLRQPDAGGEAASWPVAALGPQEAFLAEAVAGLEGAVRIVARPGRRSTALAIAIERGGEVVCESHWRLEHKRRYLALDQIRSLPGNGDLVPRLLANLVRFAKSRGARALQLTAALEVGAYIWARYGLAPRRPAWRRLRLELACRLALRAITLPAWLVTRGWRLLRHDNPRAIGAVARLGHGKGRGKGKGTGRSLLAGLHWRGRLEFRDRAAMRRFNRSLGARGIAPV